jgi:RNA polymerase sigma-70 factor (ECF subfamily)
MGANDGGDSGATSELITRAAEGEAAVLGDLLERHRDRLRRMVAVRLDPRLRGRIDPSDVIQDAMLEAALRLREYAADPQWSFFLWLRMLTAQRLRVVHRHHLGVQARDASREVSIYRSVGPEASTMSMVVQLLGHDPRPSEAAVRLERKLRVQQALEAMEPIDREVLALRHFERLTKPEAARVLGISEAAVAQRYFRALKRLRDVLEAMPGGAEELRP